MLELIKKAKETHSLEKEELVLLLSDDTFNEELFKSADEVRQKFVGSDVHLRALIEFSNFCKNNCLYCGIRRDNKLAKRYHLSPEEIIAHTEMAKKMGFHTVVLQSGEDMSFGLEKMCFIIQSIKALDIALTLSIGEKSYEEYEAYYKAGADRFLLRIETTDKDLYHALDPEMSWDHRKKCLQNIKAIGFETGSGSMVGLPNQTIDSIADDILFLKEMKVDMAGIGPFIPHPETPLKDATGRAFTLSLKTMALTRLLLPDINIPATTAMEALNPEGRMIALNSGANVVMPNITQMQYRELYQLYPGKVGLKDTPDFTTNSLCQKIRQLGRTIGAGKGFRGEFLKTQKKESKK